jgi:hypothetical protein
MALTQSLGLMTPTQQAKAMAKVDWAMQVLEHWQTQAPPEAFELIKGTYEEEWKPEDIEAFKASILSVRSLSVSSRARTFPGRSWRWSSVTSPPCLPGCSTSRIRCRYRSGRLVIKRVLGIDFDLGNYDAFKRLAARRYQNAKQEMAMLTPNEAFTIVPDPASGYPTRQLRPEIQASLLQDIRTQPQQTDSHLVFIEYYTDQLNGLVGAKDPDEIMVEVCKMYISTHRALVAQSAVQSRPSRASRTRPAMPWEPLHCLR